MHITQDKFLHQATGTRGISCLEPSNQKTRESENRSPSEKGRESQGAGSRELQVADELHLHGGLSLEPGVEQTADE